VKSAGQTNTIRTTAPRRRGLPFTRCPAFGGSILPSDAQRPPRVKGLPAPVAIVLAVLAVCAPQSPAETKAASQPASRPLTPQQQAEALVGQFRKDDGGIVGASAVNVRTAETLFSINADEPMTPASNQKLLTAAAALAKLGSGFRFTTAICLSGKDIVLLGDGDPMLGDPRRAAATGQSIYRHVDLWAAAIRRKTGAKLAGDILVVRRVKKFRHPDWPKSQYVSSDCAPVASLNFHNNCYDVTFRVAGDTTQAVVTPQSSFIRVVSRLSPGEPHLWSLSSASDESSVTIRGTVKATTDPYSAPVSNPPLLLGRVLADRIVRAGVAFDGKVRTVESDDVKWDEAVALHETTTPLSIAMRRANKRSLNMAAECIFLRLGSGEWDRSANVVASILRAEYGLDERSFVVRDGGGLSRRNRISAAAMTKLLAVALRRKDAEVFLESLPISGLDGTLKRRLTDPSCRRRVLAKTGSLAGVSCLSGYVLDGAGEPAVAFSVLVNRTRNTWRAKALQDAICRMLVDSVSSLE